MVKFPYCAGISAGREHHCRGRAKRGFPAIPGNIPCYLRLILRLFGEMRRGLVEFAQAGQDVAIFSRA
jgi:hypothetical protein